VPLAEATPNRFSPYWLPLRGGDASDHKPLEVLACLHRDGIVSHASALLFHDLTQLQLDQHFLTVPVAAKPRGPGRPAKEVSTRTSQRQPRLGTQRFVLDGQSYRTRTLTASLVFGTRSEWVDRNEQIQVFDLERSLLNTLTDPDCNGGLRGVLEAWERASERLLVPTLLDYLGRFDRGPLWRRAGALAEHLGMKELAERAKSALELLPANPTPIPLVIGRSDGNLLHPWQVIAPW
jgi:predicted transcriptional regulator of viral defense system